MLAWVKTRLGIQSNSNNANASVPQAQKVTSPTRTVPTSQGAVPKSAPAAAGTSAQRAQGAVPKRAPAAGTSAQQAQRPVPKRTDGRMTEEEMMRGEADMMQDWRPVRNRRPFSEDYLVEKRPAPGSKLRLDQKMHCLLELRKDLQYTKTPEWQAEREDAMADLVAEMQRVQALEARNASAQNASSDSSSSDSDSE